VSTPNTPLLSVIIVAYKSRDEIGACLASLPPTLEGRAVEVTVVDNSPGDGTGEIVRAQFPHVAYLEPARGEKPRPDVTPAGAAANNRAWEYWKRHVTSGK